MKKSELIDFLKQQEYIAKVANSENYNNLIIEARKRKAKKYEAELAALDKARAELNKALEKARAAFKEVDWDLDHRDIEYLTNKYSAKRLVDNYNDSELVTLRRARRDREDEIHIEYLNVFNNAMLLKPAKRVEYLKSLGFEVEEPQGVTCTAVAVPINKENLFIPSKEE